MALIGGFAAVFGATAPAGAATTESFALSSAAVSGQSSIGWQVGLGTPPATPNAFPDQDNPLTLTGQIDSATGAISGASLTFPPIPQPPNTGQNPTFTIGEVHPGTATGTFDSTTGAVTLNDALTITLTVEPIGFVCTSQPVNVALSGTWDSTTQDVTLATTSSFTIPQFPSASPCSPAATAGLNASPGGTAGSVGNSLTVALNGQFAPGLPTTTTLAATPPSPQLAGTSVTLSATVTDPSGTGTPTGNVNFLNNGALIGTAPLSSGAASLSTTALPGGTNQLSAVYSGDTTYAQSASATQNYAMQPLPSISADIPSQMIAGTSAQFTMTIANPASGQSYANTYVWIWTNGPLFHGKVRPTISYQDSAGNWCALTFSKQTWYFSGAGTPPCGAPASSIPLNAGSTVSVPMEISYPSGSSGTDVIQVGLTTGSCSSATKCTAEAPFTKPVWDNGTGPGVVDNVTVLPPTGLGTAPTTVTDQGNSFRTATSPLRQGFDITLGAVVTQSVTATSVYAFPSGTVQFFVDGSAVGVASLPDSGGDQEPSSFSVATDPIYDSDTASLAPGTHSVVMSYSGDQFFAPSSLAESFTVTAPPPTGSLYTCTVSGLGSGTFAGYVTATAYGIPATAAPGSTVNASGVTVTLDADPVLDGFASGSPYAPSTGGGQSDTTIAFSPNGTSATPGPIPWTGGRTSTDFTGTWSNLSTTVTVTGSPGDTVELGVSGISFNYAIANADTLSCVPVDQPASLGTTMIPGNVLSASPGGSSPAGAPVTLTTTVYPPPPDNTYAGTWGQVDFYDGSTDLGTVPVVTSGHNSIANPLVPPLPPDNGTATFTTANLATGDHQLTAVWSGNLSLLPSTSNTVDYQVGTNTTTTVASSANPANAADPVTFTATVSPPLGALTQPTGDVSFSSDGDPISSCEDVALSMDSPPVAACTTSFGAGESHSIVATYSGDDTYLGSASDPLTQTTLPGTNTTILSTKDPSPAGPVTFWAGVSPSSGTGATPTGTVAFSIDGSIYKPCNAAPLGPGGGASCTVSFKAGTTHKVSATYPGSDTYSGSKSNTITQTVTGSSGSTGPRDTGGSATLNPGQSLTAGQSISTGAYKFVMQRDGNLVEYQGSKALWASHTAGHPGAGVVMQKDGNLVEYFHGHAIWASGTAGHPGAHLTLQASDGNVVIYQGATALWSTGT